MSTLFIVKVLYLYGMALILALLEIEIESKYGWAEKLPTWYDTTSIFGKIYGLFMGGKPLTGYHLFLQIFCVQIFFIPYVYGFPFTIGNVLSTLMTFFVWAAFWDNLWFIFNPYYGWKNFRQNTVWWFAKSKWFFGIPMDYIMAVGGSLVVLVLYEQIAGHVPVAGWPSFFGQVVWKHVAMILTWIVFHGFMIRFSNGYRLWRMKMYEKNDRKTLDIFHKL